MSSPPLDGLDAAAVATMLAVTARATGSDPQAVPPPRVALALTPPKGPPHHEANPHQRKDGAMSDRGVPDHLQASRALLADQNVVGPTRMALPKRGVMRMSRLFTHRLVSSGQELVDAVELDHAALVTAEERETDLADRLLRVETHLRQLDSDSRKLTGTMAAQLTGLETTVRAADDELDRRLTDLSDGVTDGYRRISAREQDEAYLRAELSRTRALLDRVVRELGGRGQTAAPAAPDASSATVGTASAADDAAATAQVLDDSSYLEFEHRFRGSADEIRARQEDMLRFVAGPAERGGRLLDLGCGRGEWIGLLRDAGISAYGVDTNPDMAAQAIADGLDVRVGDALTHLAEVEPSSLAAVSAFHFVEHIPLAQLTELLDKCLLALRPGGVVLFETPNPTNVSVGAGSFYLDPTHLRPVHPLFLSFLAESRGYTDVQVHYVHPTHPEAADDGYWQRLSDPRLARVAQAAEWALFGPQDYLLAASRPAPPQ